MNTWFTSDTHWGHSKIIEHSHRPFESIGEMDEVLIERWNKVVKRTILFIILEISISDLRTKQIIILANLMGISILYGVTMMINMRKNLKISSPHVKM